MEIPHAAGHLAASGVGVAKAAHRHRSSVVGKINFAASLERKASYRLVSLVPKSGSTRKVLTRKVLTRKDLTRKVLKTPNTRKVLLTVSPTCSKKS